MSVSDWASYDGIADTYDAIAVPHYFQPPAARLVEALKVSSTDRVLDAGAGTGIVAELAMRRSPSVVAADASCSMLLRSKRRGLKRCVVSALPALALADRSFDCVAASFVLNHISCLDVALREITRILRPGGRLGATSWAQGPSDNEIGSAWSETAREFVDGSMLAAQARQALPGEEWLSDPKAFHEVLSGAGFSVLSLDELEFSNSIATADYVQSRSAALTARFMRSVLPSAEWDRFEAEARERLLSRFGPRLNFSTRVNVAIAASPRAS